MTEYRKLAIRLEEALIDASVHLEQSGEGDVVVREGKGFGDADDDTEIAADRSLGQFFQQRFVDHFPEVGHISVEGHPDWARGRGDMWACVDPLDGSLNYKTRGITLGLPYAACVTLLGRREGARFGDIIAAGVIDLRTEDRWIAWRQETGRYLTQVNQVEAQTLDIQAADLSNAIVIGEAYYPDNRALMGRAFEGEAGYLRSVGAAGYEMALVASGTIAAFVCATQKQHELGAGYALVNGAGGSVTDFEGRPLDEVPFTFHAKTPVILAANPSVRQDLVRRLQRTS